jgi:hypothetical protein
VTVELVNVGSRLTREVVIQAGAFAEHTWTDVRVAHHNAPSERTHLSSEDASPYVRVALEPSAAITLELSHRRYASAPTMRFPWD